MKLFEKSKHEIYFFNVSFKFVNKKTNYVLTLHVVEGYLVTTSKL